MPNLPKTVHRYRMTIRLQEIVGGSKAEQASAENTPDASLPIADQAWHQVANEASSLPPIAQECETPEQLIPLENDATMKQF